MTAGIEFSLDDTIAATASPPGAGLRGIIRVSGSDVVPALDALFEPDDAATWSDCRHPHRHAGRIRLDGGTSLSVAVLHWPLERSYTGQPSAEIHLVGSAPLIEAVLSGLFAAGVRPARAGEFTLRAFLAGRIDLLQAEAVLGVIDASDDVRLRAALSQLAGGISGRIADLHERLLLDLADLEAGLDFVEEDIEFIDRGALAANLCRGADIVSELLSQATERMQSRARVRVVLAGPPNAGKSTLFNALAGSAAALVSPIAGTTRDYLSADLCWEGRSIELLDTAGCTDGDGELMQSAHLLRERELRDADVVLWCIPADAPGTDATVHRVRSGPTAHPFVLPVITKSDLAIGLRDAGLRICARTGEGLEALCRAVIDGIDDASAPQELIGTSAARCRDSLRDALTALESAYRLCVQGAGEELIAAELRSALEHTGRIAGRVYTDDILDRIFSRFCIGK